MRRSVAVTMDTFEGSFVVQSNAGWLTEKDKDARGSSDGKDEEESD